MAFNSKYGSYAKGPVNSYPVNLKPPVSSPGYSNMPYQFPTKQPATVGGFGPQASAAPTGAIPQLAARLAGGPNPGSGLPGSIPAPSTPGTIPGDSTGTTPGSTPGASGAGGVSGQDPNAPYPSLQQLAGVLAGRGGWQQPTGPDGRTSSTAAAYFVPNNMTIDQITGGAPNPNMTSYQANSGFSPAQFAQIGFTLQADPAGNMYYALPPGAPAPNTG